ncbi:MAG: right-handed parallel beta-helix repeat-containing protein [Xanthomonadaceae bacterium]|nr:right-handed parallel beta-helix repeat-containing protein [Xanthomonadaceae bacterium]
MNLADTLRRAADAEQLTLHPLPTHSLAQASEHTRLQYASVLAALLSAQDAVSEPQSRLLALLLQALDLGGDPRAALFEAVRGWDQATLCAALRSVCDADAERALVLDALVLLRLDAPLPEASAQTLADLAAFLGLGEPELAELAHYAALLLGLPTDGAAQGPAEAKGTAKGSAKAGAKDAAQATPPQPAPQPDPLLAELLTENWPNLIPERLTVDDLLDGIEGGLWFVDETLEIHQPWTAQGATFLFRSGSTIHTTLAQKAGAPAAALAITGCRFVGARLRYTGSGSLKVQDCDFSGQYDPALQASAIDSTGVVLDLQNSRFTVHQARAVACNGAALQVQGCNFTDCGHPELDGGALWLGVAENLSQQITNSRFERCSAHTGGALWAHYLNQIESCEFIDCTSAGRKDEPNLAVHCAIRTKGNNPAVSGCVFRNSSLNLADASYRHAGGSTFVSNSQFHISQLYFYRKHNDNTIASNCTFNGGQTIDHKLQ